MKAPHQLEHRVLTILDALSAGMPLPPVGGLTAHFRVWPGLPQRAARMLAAFANTARGSEVLWLIGVKLATGGKITVPGVALSQFETWLNGLLPFFDGLAPSVRAFSIPTPVPAKTPAGQLVALQIETARAPFVVRREARTTALEVPWWDRDSQQIRSAGRADLIRLLAPVQELPHFEVLEAELSFYKNQNAVGASKITHRWTLDGSLYAIPGHGTQVVIPLHRCKAALAIPESGFSSPAVDLTLTSDKQSPAIRITQSAALIEGLGRMFFYCSGSTSAAQVPWDAPLTLTFDLLPAGSDRAAVVSARLQPAIATENNQAGRWKL